MFTVNKARLAIYLSAIAYVAMIGSNILANLIPINGLNTGQISDSYFNLFAPIGSTFAIWGLIYFLLGYYLFVQLMSLKDIKNNAKTITAYKINISFIITSLLNTAWIFLWHYQLILLSLIVIVGMLIVLGYTSLLLAKRQDLEKITFGVYFGWITVATIANATIYLVSLGLPNNTVGATLQTIVIILVAILIGAFTTIKQKDLGYGLVIFWALFGIYQKHISPLYFDYGYISIVNTTIFGMSVIFLSLVFTFYQLRKQLKKS
jgi:hypothetical protein